MRSFRDSLATRLKDEDFRKEYENIQPEMDIIRAIIAARKDQNITQADLAARTKINQADISKLENGSKNPSLKMLKRLAKGLNMDLKIQFVPRTA
ncbi:MAG: helix-turn-helix transcriptional regulator [Selenomonadaceae bacterium]|nr:helix-turn-helix transcriptional regulator [Selenomonadaceae bacterium]